MKATVHYWKPGEEEKELTLETEEGEEFTKDNAIKLVPNFANIEHIEVTK